MATSGGGGGMSNLGCPLPFVSDADFPYKGGGKWIFRTREGPEERDTNKADTVDTELAGRFCGNITDGQACCLPCPSQEWIYSDGTSLSMRTSSVHNVRMTTRLMI